MNYIGRFAPSPSGPLHFGSLVAAFGSWLDARAHNGQWLVRIEDLDPPREVAGATEQILASLQAHQLISDDKIIYQSERLTEYDRVLAKLSADDHLYACYCTRKQIRAQGGLHERCSGSANTTSAENSHAVRIIVNNNSPAYEDLFQGPQMLNDQQANEDFILKRKDGLHAYMLAVVVDDIHQGVSHIIRGADLAHSTCQQQYLFDMLGQPAPRFGHLPMAIHPDGSKLSKQTHASAIDDTTPLENLYQVLSFLNQSLPESVSDFSSINALFDWAIKHWDPSQFHDIREKLATA